MKKYKLVYYIFIIQVCKLEMCFGRQLHTPSKNSNNNSSKLSPLNGSKLANMYSNLIEMNRFIGKSSLFKMNQVKTNENSGSSEITKYAPNVNANDFANDKTSFDEYNNQSNRDKNDNGGDSKSTNCSKCNRNKELDNTADMYNNSSDTSDLSVNSVSDAGTNARFDATKATISKLNSKRNVLMSLSNKLAPSGLNSQPNTPAQFSGSKSGSSNYPYDPSSGYSNGSMGYGNTGGYGMDQSGGGMAPPPVSGSGAPMGGGVANSMGSGINAGMGGDASAGMASQPQSGGYAPESYPPAGSVPGSTYPSSDAYGGQSGYGSDSGYGYGNDWNNSSGYGNGSYPDYNPESNSNYSDEDDIHDSWKCRFLAIFFPECTDKKPKNRYRPPPNPMAPVAQQYCNIYGTTDLNLSDFLCNVNDWLLVNQNNSIRLTSNKPVSNMQTIELKGNYCNKESVSCTVQLGENSTAGLSVRGLNGERTLIELNSLTKTISLKQINNQTTQILLETPYSKMNSNFLHLVQVNDGGFQGTLSVFVDGDHVFSKRDIPTQSTGLIGLFISSGNATFGNLSITPS